MSTHVRSSICHMGRDVTKMVNQSASPCVTKVCGLLDWLTNQRHHVSQKYVVCLIG